MDDLSTYRNMIDDYLLGRLETGERVAFENAVKSNPELRQELEESRLLMEGIGAAARAGLKERLGALDRSVPYQKRRSNAFMRRRFAIAAAVLLLLVPGYFIAESFLSVNTEAVFNEHFEPYPVLESGQVRGSADETALSEGLRAYQDANHVEAIAAFERHAGESGNHSVANFYRALSHLAIGEASEALPLLEKLSADEGFAMCEQAAFYRALALLKMERTDEARDALRSLSATAQDPAIRRRALEVSSDL